MLHLYICAACLYLLPPLTGSFFLNNYKQAVKIIQDYVPGVRTWKDCLGICSQDIDAWLEDKKKLLGGLKAEPEERVLACAYVEVLQTCQAAE